MAETAAVSMPFLWEGTDRKGNKVKGKSMATTEAAVRNDLRRQGVVGRAHVLADLQDPTLVHDWLDVAIQRRHLGETGEHVLSLRTGHLVRQQLDAQGTVAEEVVRVWHRHAFEHRPHARRVLLGEHFGRGHQRSQLPPSRCPDRSQPGRIIGTDACLPERRHR